MIRESGGTGSDTTWTVPGPVVPEPVGSTAASTGPGPRRVAGARTRGQSAFAPDALTTGPQRSTSVRSIVAISSGPLPMIT